MFVPSQTSQVFLLAFI